MEEKKNLQDGATKHTAVLDKEYKSNFENKDLEGKLDEISELLLNREFGKIRELLTRSATESLRTSSTSCLSTIQSI